MIHSKNFYKIQNYYETGIWGIQRVKAVVGKSTGITQEEYTEITGFVYPATE